MINEYNRNHPCFLCGQNKKVEIPTAKESKDAAHDIQFVQQVDVRAKVRDMIVNATLTGEQMISVGNIRLSPALKEELERLGYKIIHIGGDVIIRWV